MKIGNIFVIIFLTLSLAACGGGSDSDGGNSGGGNGGGGTSGGGHGGDNGGGEEEEEEEEDREIQLEISVPDTINYGEEITVSYQTENVDTMSVSSIYGSIDVDLDEDSKQLTISLTDNMAGEHGFSINYSNAYNSSNADFVLSSTYQYLEPTISVNGMINNVSLSMYYNVPLEVPIEVGGVSNDYSLDISSSSGIEASYSSGYLLLETNSTSEIGLSEQVILSLIDGQDIEDELRIEVYITEEGNQEISEFFCFVGYCDEQNPEPNDYVGVDGHTYSAHFTAIRGTELKFSYRVPSDFGLIQRSSFTVDGITYDSHVSFDTKDGTLSINTRGLEFSGNQQTIRFNVYNVDGQSESVSYEFRFRNVIASGGVIYIDTVSGEPFFPHGNDSHSFELEVKNSSLGGFKEDEREFVIQSFESYSPTTERLFDVSLDSNILNLKRSSESTDMGHEYNSIFGLLIHARCLSCSSGNDMFRGMFYFYYVDDVYLGELEYYEPLKNKYTMYGASYFELDSAIDFFETVLDMNDIALPYQKDVVDRGLRTVNNGLSQHVGGFHRNFLEHKRNPMFVYEFWTGHSWLYDDIVANDFNYSTFGRNETFERTLSQYIENIDQLKHDTKRVVNREYDYGSSLNGYQYKIEVLNSLIEEFNRETGSRYATLSVTDLPNQPYEFNNTYSYLVGNSLFGEFDDNDNFIFNEEYAYLSGINEMLRTKFK